MYNLLKSDFPSVSGVLSIFQLIFNCETRVNFCIESNEEEQIIDSVADKISKFVSCCTQADMGIHNQLTIQNVSFHIHNPNNENFCLLQIDNGTVKNEKTTEGVKRCDCAVISKNILCFIEFKTYSSSSCKDKTKDSNYKKAYRQLSATTDLFQSKLKSKNLNLNTVRKVSAYICFKKNYTHIPRCTRSYAVKFLNKFNIPLHFKNELTI